MGINRYGLQTCSLSDEQGNICIPCPRSRLKIWFSDTRSTVPSRVSTLSVHTQAESGAYSWGSSRFPRWRPFIIPPTAIPLVPSLSDHAIAYQWCSPPRVYGHRASRPQVGSSDVGCLLRLPRVNQLWFTLLFPHPLSVQWTCVIQRV